MSSPSPSGFTAASLAVAVLAAVAASPPARAQAGTGDAAPRTAAPTDPRAGSSAPRGAEDPSSQRIQLMGVRTATAVDEPGASSLRAPAFVAPDEERRVSVSARFSGFVEGVPVSDGQLVEKGQVLATVYSQDAIAAQQQLVAVRRLNDPRSQGTRIEGAATAERSARARLAALGFAQQDVEALVATGVPSRTVNIRAPRGGFVARRAATVGGYAAAGTELFQLVNLSVVWVIVNVPAADLSRVRVGQRGTVELTALPGQRFGGRVAFVSPAVALDTRSIQIRIAVQNPGLRLRPGMLGEATLDAATPRAVTVPADAVVDTGERRWVFVTEDGGHFTPRAVTVGWVENGRAAILAGVAAGERVARDAAFLLDSETRLRGVLEGRSSAGRRRCPTGARLDRDEILPHGSWHHHLDHPTWSPR